MSFFHIFSSCCYECYLFVGPSKGAIPKVQVPGRPPHGGGSASDHGKMSKQPCQNKPLESTLWTKTKDLLTKQGKLKYLSTNVLL